MLTILADFLSSSLGSILEKKSLAPSKLDEIQIKLNILRAFIEEPKKEEEPKIAKAESEL